MSELGDSASDWDRLHHVGIWHTVGQIQATCVESLFDEAVHADTRVVVALTALVFTAYYTDPSAYFSH